MKIDIAALMESKFVPSEICRRTRSIFNNVSVGPGSVSTIKKGNEYLDDYLYTATFSNNSGVKYEVQRRTPDMAEKIEYYGKINDILFLIEDHSFIAEGPGPTLGHRSLKGVINMFDFSNTNGVFIVTFKGNGKSVEYKIDFYDAEAVAYYGENNKNTDKKITEVRDFKRFGIVPDQSTFGTFEGSTYVFANSVIKNPHSYMEKIEQGKTR